MHPGPSRWSFPWPLPINRRTFPLAEPRLAVVAAPVVAIGVGPVGQAIIEHARRLRSHPDLVLLLDTESIESWQEAERTARQRRQANDVLLDGRQLEMVLLGGLPESEAEQKSLADRVLELTSARPVATVQLILEQGPAVPLRIADRPARCFRMAKRYFHGELTEQEQIALVARLLERGLARHLVRFADRHAGEQPVMVGGALSWLPEVRIETALAYHALARCGRELARGLPGPGVPALMAQCWSGELSADLKAQFDHEAALLRNRLASACRAAPLFGLDVNEHAGVKLAMQLVAAHSEQTIAHMLSCLDELCRRQGLVLIHFVVGTAVREVEQTMAELARRESRLASRRRLMAAKVQHQDEARLLVAGYRRPWRWLCRWWRTWRTKRLLKEFSRMRSSELLARYQRLALEGIARCLQSIRNHLAWLAEDALAAEARLATLLEPDHPNLVPIQDWESLQTLVEELARAGPDGPGRLIWNTIRNQAEAASSCHPGTGDNAESLLQAAHEWTRTLPDVSRSLAARCHGLLPRYEPDSLEAILELKAKPWTTSVGGTPRVQSIVRLDDDGGLPALIYLHWLFSNEEGGPAK